MASYKSAFEFQQIDSDVNRSRFFSLPIILPSHYLQILKSIFTNSVHVKHFWIQMFRLPSRLHMLQKAFIEGAAPYVAKKLSQ